MLKSLVNGKIYVGSTQLDVGKRLLQHNLGANKWTKGNGPFKLVYYESFICKTDAILREKFYNRFDKTLSSGGRDEGRGGLKLPTTILE